MKKTYGGSCRCGAIDMRHDNLDAPPAETRHL